MKILVVEDEAIIAEDIREILLDMNHKVRWVTNPEAAKKSAISGWPEVILMDVNLRAKGDGLTAAYQILEDLDIPVVFVTSTPLNEVFVDSRSVGCGYCGKPVYPEKLSRAIQKAIAARALHTPFSTSQAAGKGNH